MSSNNRGSAGASPAATNIAEETWNVLLKHDSLVKHFQTQLQQQNNNNNSRVLEEVQGQVFDLLLVYNENTKKLMELQMAISGLLLKKNNSNTSPAASSATTTQTRTTPQNNSSTSSSSSSPRPNSGNTTAGLSVGTSGVRAKSPQMPGEHVAQQQAPTRQTGTTNTSSSTSGGGHGRTLPKPPVTNSLVQEFEDPFFSSAPVVIAPIVTSSPAPVVRQSPVSPAPVKAVTKSPLVEDIDIFGSVPPTTSSPKPVSQSPVQKQQTSETPAPVPDVDVFGSLESKKPSTNVNELDAFLGTEELMLSFGEDSSKLTRQMKIMNLFDDIKTEPPQQQAVASPSTTLDAMFE